MKNHRFIWISILFLLLQFSYAQTSSLTIKVVNSDSMNGINSALVFIDELNFADTETDSYGVAYFENVPLGKISINIRKQGFKPYRGNFNVTNNPNHNSARIELVEISNHLHNRDSLERNKGLEVVSSPGSIIMYGDNNTNQPLIQTTNQSGGQNIAIKEEFDAPKPELRFGRVIRKNEIVKEVVLLKNSERINYPDGNIPHLYRSTFTLFYECEFPQTKIGFVLSRNDAIEYRVGMYGVSRTPAPGNSASGHPGYIYLNPINGEYEVDVWTKSKIPDLTRVIEFYDQSLIR